MENCTLKYRRIAVDFDGTIAEDGAFPDIGKIKWEAVRVLKRYKEAGGRIIIWTCRTGEQAERVKDALALVGIKYDAFNENLPETKEAFPDDSRKIFADVYIDDRANFCEEINWDWIESKLFVGGSG
jgi:hydroxymethylpyrimidine pyrophosphatase-like HAD family hydrolase